MYSDVTYIITGATITNCQAENDGGAIYLRNIKSMVLTSTKITNCLAPKGNGGGI